MNPAEEYICSQAEPYSSMLMHIQVVIERAVPDAELKFKWRIPCYYVGAKSPLCYLNVSHKKGYVDVAFWNAAHFTVHPTKFVTEGRKVVKSLRYRSLAEIDDAVLIAVLEEAYSLRNKGFWRKDD